MHTTWVGWSKNSIFGHMHPLGSWKVTTPMLRLTQLQCYCTWLRLMPRKHDFVHITIFTQIIMKISQIELQPFFLHHNHNHISPLHRSQNRFDSRLSNGDLMSLRHAVWSNLILDVAQITNWTVHQVVCTNGKCHTNKLHSISLITFRSIYFSIIRTNFKLFNIFCPFAHSLLL